MMCLHLIMASAQSSDDLHRFWKVSAPGPDGAPAIQGTRRLLLGVSSDVEARALPSKGRISVRHGARNVQVSTAASCAPQELSFLVSSADLTPAHTICLGLQPFWMQTCAHDLGLLCRLV